MKLVFLLENAVITSLGAVCIPLKNHPAECCLTYFLPADPSLRSHHTLAKKAQTLTEEEITYTPKELQDFAIKYEQKPGECVWTWILRMWDEGKTLTTLGQIYWYGCTYIDIYWFWCVRTYSWTWLYTWWVHQKKLSGGLHLMKLRYQSFPGFVQREFKDREIGVSE